MDIRVSKNNSECIIDVCGRLDTNTAPALEQCIRENAADSAVLVLDFAKLEYISSAGLRVLLTTQKIMSARGGSFILKNVGDDVMEVFEITGFSDILTIEKAQ